MKKIIFGALLLSVMLASTPFLALAEKDAKTCTCEDCSNKDKHTCSDETCDCDKCDCHKSHKD